MDDFQKELIAGLEEKQDFHLHDEDDYGAGKYYAFDEAICLTKQLIRKHNNIFCKWTKTQFKTFTNCGKEIDYSSFKYDEYNFCPYCGRKINVIV